MEHFPGMQDIWGQFPRMKGYTHLAACFAHPEATSRVTTSAALVGATRRIVSTIPWIGGAVVHLGEKAGDTGSFTVARCEETEAILKIQDRSDECPTFDDILQNSAASKMLEGSLLSAESALPDSYTESEESPAPVLTITATWIKGGLILTCAAQHNILDMGGIDQFFRLLATALQGEQFDPAVIEANTKDRLKIIPLLEEGEQSLDHSLLRCPPSSTPTVRPPPPPGTQPAFHYFRFSAANLSLLALNAQTPSQDDALSAFIWQRLSLVRQSLGRSPDAITGFSRAVDCRRPLDVATEYMGVVVAKTASQMTFAEMSNSSLESIAAQLRRDVQRLRDREYLRSLSTLIVNEPDKSTFNFVKGFDPDTWINASSWAGAATHRLEYGLLGTPAFVRRPNAKPVQSLLYFLPMLPTGDIDVLLCLKDEEIEGLRADPDWNGLATYIG